MVPARIDLAGKRFGRLLALERVGVDRGGSLLWACECECGSSVVVSSAELRRKTNPTRSCGCIRAKDFLGRQCGLLTVVRRVEGSKTGYALWECRCDCGGTCVRSSKQLRTVSRELHCGCLTGRSRTPEYWRAKQKRLRQSPEFRAKKRAAEDVRRLKALRASPAWLEGIAKSQRARYAAARKVNVAVRPVSDARVAEQRVRDKRRNDRAKYYRMKAERPEQWREKMYARERRRRAREKNAVSERFSRAEIFERDGGRCHYCGVLVDPADWHLAHLVALAAGGSDTRANVAVSHPACNLADGVGRLSVQLRLAA